MPEGVDQGMPNYDTPTEFWSWDQMQFVGADGGPIGGSAGQDFAGQTTPDTFVGVTVQQVVAGIEFVLDAYGKFTAVDGALSLIERGMQAMSEYGLSPLSDGSIGPGVGNTMGDMLGGFGNPGDMISNGPDPSDIGFSAGRD